MRMFIERPLVLDGSLITVCSPVWKLPAMVGMFSPKRLKAEFRDSSSVISGREPLSASYRIKSEGWKVLNSNGATQ